MSLLQIENLGVRFHGKTVASTQCTALRWRSKGRDGRTGGRIGFRKVRHRAVRFTAFALSPRHPPTRRTRFGGEELLGAKTDRMRALRGGRISMIFQEPMTSLNPLHSIEKQISETLILHRGLDKAQARTRTVELLRQVGCPT